MNRFPILDPGVAGALGQHFFKSHDEWPNYGRLVQAGPIWDRQAVATSPVTVSFFGTARTTAITGNNKKAGALGGFFKLITGIKLSLLMESAATISLDATEVIAGSFLKFKVEDYDWIDTIPCHHFVDGLHVTGYSNITPAATELRNDIGRHGDGSPFPVMIPYMPDQNVTCELVWSDAGDAGIATAMVAEVSLFGPRWYRAQGR